MSNVQQTSLAPYFDEVRPTLGQRQQRVLMAIRQIGPACNQQIADFLQKPINTVTPRVFELRKLGKVELDRKDIYAGTGRKVIFWKEKT
jgi:hypothetical protein